MHHHPGMRRKPKRKRAEEATPHTSRETGPWAARGRGQGIFHPLAQSTKGPCLAFRSLPGPPWAIHGLCASCRAPGTTENPGRLQARQAAKPSKSPGGRTGDLHGWGFAHTNCVSTSCPKPPRCMRPATSQRGSCTRGPGAPGQAQFGQQNLELAQVTHTPRPTRRGRPGTKANTHHHMRPLLL